MTNSIDPAMWLMFGVIIGFGITVISIEIGAMYKRVRKETSDTRDSE